MLLGAAVVELPWLMPVDEDEVELELDGVVLVLLGLVPVAAAP